MLKTHNIVVGYTAGAALVAGAAAAFDAVTLADYSGQELFARFCASCHGETGRGDGPVARSLAAMVPDLTTIENRYGEFPAARVRESIDGRGLIDAHGTRVMPVWGYEFWVESGADAVAEREAHELIDKLVEYIESIQGESQTTRN
jgi:mono/diheme cytochrome c family protein